MQASAAAAAGPMHLHRSRKPYPHHTWISQTAARFSACAAQESCSACTLYCRWVTEALVYIITAVGNLQKLTAPSLAAYSLGWAPHVWAPACICKPAKEQRDGLSQLCSEALHLLPLEQDQQRCRNLKGALLTLHHPLCVQACSISPLVKNAGGFAAVCSFPNTACNHVLVHVVYVHSRTTRSAAAL